MKYFVCLLVLAFTFCMATGAMAGFYDEQYEFTNDVTLAGGAAHGFLMEAATGSGTFGADGLNYLGNGVAEFLDDASSSSNQGVRLNNAGALLGSAGYTADFRIKYLQGTTGSADCKSLGFAGEVAGGSKGRALTLYGDRIEYRGNGLFGTAMMDMSDWLNLRVVVQSDGSQSLYVQGSTTALMTITAPGGTGVNGAITAGNGFFVGSWGGSSTTLTNFQIDYLRIARGTDVSATYDDYYNPPAAPEPGSILALASGLIGMTGFAMRRRRA